MSDINNKNYFNYLLIYSGITTLTSIYYYTKYKNLQYSNNMYKKYILINPEEIIYNLKVDNKIF